MFIQIVELGMYENGKTWTSTYALNTDEILTVVKVDGGFSVIKTKQGLHIQTQWIYEDLVHALSIRVGP